MVVHERRDHRIAVPRPDLSDALGTPNACAACHRDRGNAWAAAAIASHRSGRRQGPSGAELLGPTLWSIRHEQRDAATSLQALLANPDVASLSKATALSALADSAPAAAAAIAEPLLRDGDPWLRLGAVQALRATSEPTRVRLLASLTSDGSRAVRRELAPSLANATGAGDIESLLGEYRGWLTANADRAEALVELASLERAAGSPSAARADFERALRRDDSCLVAYLNFADELRTNGDDARAETLLRKAGALYPGSAEAHFALGMLLVRRGKIASGVSELGRANELAPDNSRYAYTYGVGLHSTRQDRRALITLSDARARFPDNAPIETALRALCASVPSPDPRCP